ncbi:MAG: diaminopimelate decarboxylase [Actinobacteria bacterium]|nr:diaminopimelate decarboxylase [Actinomycetota bacterium]
MLLPITSKINSVGNIEIGGCDVSELKAKYKTPLFIIDIATVKKQCKDYKDFFNFPDFSTEIIYASKAFCSIAMCQLVKREGLSIDVSTGGELFIALKSGFNPESIYFHGNNKSNDEISFGLDHKIGFFVVDNFTELENLCHLAGQRSVRQKIMLRITPGIEAHTHKYIQTGTLESKFGFAINDNIAINAVKKASESDAVELAGIHAHIGSQIFNIEAYDKLIEKMICFIGDVKNSLGVNIKHINIGGGLGIKYIPDDRPAEIKDLAKVVRKAVNKYSKENGVIIEKVYLEPGRSMIGNAGTTLYEVGNIKEIPKVRNYIAIDGGMSDNIRPVLYQAKYNAYIANRAFYLRDIENGELKKTRISNRKKSLSKSDEQKMYSIVGKHCESGDIVIEEIILPEVKLNDLILVSCTGAYCYSMSSNYNGQTKSAVVAVEDGKSWLWVERQSYDDLVAKDKKLYQK